MGDNVTSDSADSIMLANVKSLLVRSTRFYMGNQWFLLWPSIYILGLIIWFSSSMLAGNLAYDRRCMSSPLVQRSVQASRTV